MADVKEINFTMTKLAGAANYDDWRWQLDMVLRAKDLWDVVSGDEARPEGAQRASAWDKKTSQALALISLTCLPRIQTLIKSLRDPIAILTKLDATFRPKGVAHMIKLRAEYHRFGASVGEPIKEMEAHIADLCAIADKRAAIGDPVDETDLVVTLLASLPDAYHTLITAIDQQREGIPDLEWIRVKILEEERRQHERNFKLTREVALVANYSPSKAINHQGRLDNNRADEKSSDPDMKCTWCGRKNHWASACRIMKSSLESIKPYQPAGAQGTSTEPPSPTRPTPRSTRVKSSEDRRIMSAHSDYPT
ncbi:unnamed protein product [Tilletia controversa]|nr:unnamed protein product [Tilletia controversa]